MSSNTILLDRPHTIKEALLWADLPANNNSRDYTPENRVMVRFGLRPDDGVLLGLDKRTAVSLRRNWRHQPQWHWLHFRECEHFNRLGYRNDGGVVRCSADVDCSSPFKNAAEAVWFARK